LLPPEPDAIVRLLLADVTPWVYRRFDDPRRSLELELEHIVDAVENTPTFADLPILLVMHVPVESAGRHGQGGSRQVATFRHLPPRLQSALMNGTFAGVLAGLEDEVEIVDDLTPAVKRSSRVWLRRPTYQVISGATGSRPVRRLRRMDGVALRPNLRSPAAGFVGLRIAPQWVEAEVHAYRGTRWTVAHHGWSARRPIRPAETDSQPLAPCPACDPDDGAADHLPPLRN